MLKPLNDFLLLQEEEATPYHEFKEYKHVIAPPAYSHGPEDRPVWGKVVGIGRACTGVTQVGDRVLTGKWGGARLTFESVKYLIVKEEDVLAVDGRD